MNLDQFSTVVDDRRYIKPQVALDESNAFIENLRNTQGQRTAEIAQDTYNLGTAVPSNLGGLGGSGSYFTSRYQTPQTNEVVANLKATAQAQALNSAMNNALAQAKQRYNNAYKAALKRKNPTNPTTPQDEDGDVEHKDSGGKKVGSKNFAGSEKRNVILYDSDGDGIKESELDMSWLDKMPGKDAAKDASDWAQLYNSIYGVK